MEELKPILSALKTLNGKLTFTDESGQEFVLMPKIEEKQLSFQLEPTISQEKSQNDGLYDVREALGIYSEPEDQLDEITFDQEPPYPGNTEDDEVDGSYIVTERRIRFEPVDGDDLSPDLQG